MTESQRRHAVLACVSQFDSSGPHPHGASVVAGASPIASKAPGNRELPVPICNPGTTFATEKYFGLKTRSIKHAFGSPPIILKIQQLS